MSRKKSAGVGTDDEPPAKKRKGQSSSKAAKGKSSRKEAPVSRQRCECDACGTWFSQSFNLRKHLKLGRCPGQRSVQKGQLRRTSLLKCTSCRVDFPSQVALKEHQEKVHQRLFFHCSLCSCWRGRWEQIVEHGRTAHGVALRPPQNMGFRCGSCRKRYISAEALREHAGECLQSSLSPKSRARGEQQKYHCTSCSTTLTSRADWKAHLEQIHQRKLFPCRRCKYWSAHWEPLMRHAVREHDILLVKGQEDRDFRCRSCNRRYVSREVLREHRRQEHGKSGRSSKPKRSLIPNEEEAEDAWEDVPEPTQQQTKEKQSQGHRPLAVPKKVGEQQINHCTSCSTTLSTRAEFKVHLEQVHQRKLFTCPNCPFWRARWLIVAQHARKQHGKELEPPKDRGVGYCGWCRKLYVSEKALRDHRSRRECVKECNRLQSCISCSLQLNSRKELRTHLEQVHQRKLFPCEKCTYWSGEWTKMVTHARNRHEIVLKVPEDMGFRCCSCKKSFVSEKVVREHRRQECKASLQIVNKAVQPKLVKKRGVPAALPPLPEVEEMIRQLHLRVDAHEREREKRFDPNFFLHLNRYKPD